MSFLSYTFSGCSTIPYFSIRYKYSIKIIENKPTANLCGAYIDMFVCFFIASQIKQNCVQLALLSGKLL